MTTFTARPYEDPERRHPVPDFHNSIRALAFIPVVMGVIIGASAVAYLALVAWLHLGERGEPEGEQ